LFTITGNTSILSQFGILTVPIIRCRTIDFFLLKMRDVLRSSSVDVTCTSDGRLAWRRYLVAVVDDARSTKLVTVCEVLFVACRTFDRCPYHFPIMLHHTPHGGLAVQFRASVYQYAIYACLRLLLLLLLLLLEI